MMGVECRFDLRLRLVDDVVDTFARERAVPEQLFFC